jgi:hypothetical protein
MSVINGDMTLPLYTVPGEKRTPTTMFFSSGPIYPGPDLVGRRAMISSSSKTRNERRAGESAGDLAPKN